MRERRGSNLTEAENQALSSPPSRAGPRVLRVGDRGTHARGFSLIDMLVSIAVVAVLLAILAPSLQAVRETTRRVVCSSNQRQVGLGIAMYSDANRERMPHSLNLAKHANDAAARPQAMIQVRIGDYTGWDGLGLLYSQNYLDSSGVFYCPSHHGNHGSARYADAWFSGMGHIFGNYHYRGDLTVVNLISPSADVPRTSLLADGMATRQDFNHIVGTNILRTDLSVLWYADTGGTIFWSLASDTVEGAADGAVNRAWDAFDADTDGLAPPE